MAEALLYLTTANADIATGLFYKYLRPAGGGTGSQTISLAKDEVQTGYGYSYPSEIDLRTGTGMITLVVHVTTTSADIICRIRAHRTDSNGSILASTDWTATQTLGASRTFTTPSVDWTAANSTDRLRIDYEFTTAAHSASATIQLGGTNPYVDTPFTNALSVSVDASGGGTTTPAAGTYYYVVAGKQVQLTAVPDDLTKKFVKWVINSIDVIENPTTVTMSQDITAVAHFDTASQYNVVISIEEGSGTVIPAVGTHAYYEQEAVTIMGEATIEGYNAIIIVDSLIVFDNVEHFGKAGFNMPSENVTAKVYFVEPFVRLERSDGDDLSWLPLSDVSDPDVLLPNNYLDTGPFTDTVEYFYRAKRVESNGQSNWSNIDSVVYIAVDTGNISISTPTAINNGQGGNVTVAATQLISVVVISPMATSISAATVPTIVSSINTIISTISATSTSDATTPTITALIVINATVIPPPTEADTEGIIPSIEAAQNISILVPQSIGEANTGNVELRTEGIIHVNIASPTALCSVEAVTPNVTSTKNASIATPSAVSNAQADVPSVLTESKVSITSSQALSEVDAVVPQINTTKLVSIVTVSGNSNSTATEPQITTVKLVSLNIPQGIVTTQAIIPIIATQQNPTVTTLPTTEVEMASAIIHWSVTLPEGGGE